MIKTLAELAEGLETLGYPVAYSHFNDSQKPPFICYLVKKSNPFSADDTVLVEEIDVDIELYVKEKDVKVEKRLKEMLKANGLIWEYLEGFIPSEGVFQCVFSITLIN